MCVLGLISLAIQTTYQLSSFAMYPTAKSYFSLTIDFSQYPRFLDFFLDNWQVLNNQDRKETNKHYLIISPVRTLHNYLIFQPRQQDLGYSI